MRYLEGEPTTVTFDTPAEIQALTWAASEMRAVNPKDDDLATAYGAALRATEVAQNSAEGYDFSLEGQEAEIVLSVLQKWVALGPPEAKGQATDAARAKSYITAQKIVAGTVELTQD